MVVEDKKIVTRLISKTTGDLAHSKSMLELYTEQVRELELALAWLKKKDSEMEVKEK